MLRSAKKLGATICVAGGLAGCAAVSASSYDAMGLGRGDAEDVTGSIAKPAAQLSAALDDEDWRRASAALNAALDPQGTGDGVEWRNPQSGAKGSISPMGPAYPADGKVCRAFRAEIAVRTGRESLEGAACRDKSAEWTLVSTQPRRRGGKSDKRQTRFGARIARKSLTLVRVGPVTTRSPSFSKAV